MNRRLITVALILGVSLTLAACGAAPADLAPTEAQPKNETAVPTQPVEIPGTPTAARPPGQPTGDSPQEPEDLTRIDSQGNVVVAVTPLNLDQPGESLAFDVVMNTHSVDLTMDLAQMATLTTDTGKTVQPSLWDAPTGGHHLSGSLTFPASVDGASLLEGANLLTLTLRNVDAPERSFAWQLTAP